MYQLEQTGKFKKDIKLAKKRGLGMRLLDEVVTQLVESGTLPPKNKPHKLTGNYKGFWECHIQPDWLLVWEQDDAIRLITLTRTGTHSDLF
ncbi:type II toxin-antitoxin system YafQ family toxin [Olivibacter sp. SDN3]|uniref:Type II toxin-antitoxin system YafQ family toxin n=1 Tax=Sphingobacterium phlebotomi TaxID=2605433 RepID=A0A5D4HBB7_9SPHI|nr:MULTISPECIES: type II toxin-antitoxin system YafQ family toxin [Sphingobacteriaceae]QNL50331.1 type II toxin-antitoxin system YafQ family toxin [Olivibacter sp. SDN3]TYR37493.1 type II toxin-antitoxin system YafQ family toxin [Sphingobacterium phlebotomi]